MGWRREAFVTAVTPTPLLRVSLLGVSANGREGVNYI